ncbi:hypothetical protein SAMN05421788_101882 [Filimonas lacunae]|uniref:Uncharacterized protein n=1 Tax=Filimonas lacunae TaxID=477680 RepID=A0A173MPQ5_9BACT|nr:hypothetical protein [Filimonas lacunae]BAV09447.1 hypothetical protein FLA_5496 [Filimonas lacunae]SIS73307.1 hypothetical protein SAMN05421788_101882 [Filimonas lacunae]
MKNILIAAGIAGAAAAGVLLYMRNRNKTSQTLHDVADAAGDAHEGVRRFFRKSNKEAKREVNHAMA